MTGRRPLAPRRAIATFDSNPAMLLALASSLRRRPFAGMGIVPDALLGMVRPLAAGLNRLPRGARQWIYARSGLLETVAARDAHRIDGQAIAAWMTARYPQQRFPAVAIGSASGALVHLCAAVGMPFLPQSFLVPLRQRGRHVDDPWADIRRGLRPARRLLEANPDLQLHQMQDPNQDRLMLSHIRYFRCKWRRVPDAYVDFLRRRLPAGATLLITDCRLRWPVTRLGERHVFQFGGHGGLSPQQYREPSGEVARFLARHNSPWGAWDPPAADEMHPEAEWGFEERLGDDLRRLAAEHGWRVQRLCFDEADDLSAPVADLYRWWYRRLGRPAGRLAVESFAMLDPWSVLRTASIPFWLEFGVEPAAAKLERHLAHSDPYDEIHVAAFPHGIESIGFADAERWQALAARARVHGSLLGIDAKAYPRDLAAFLRFSRDLQRLDERDDMPEPLALGEAEAFLRNHPDAAWTD